MAGQRINIMEVRTLFDFPSENEEINSSNGRMSEDNFNQLTRKFQLEILDQKV